MNTNYPELVVVKSDYPYPELNRELLTKVVDHALSAENWDQGIWYRDNASTACGTAMCLAGFTAIDFEGWEPVVPPGSTLTDYARKNGLVKNIDDVAQEALGLTIKEARTLFLASNSAGDIREITQDILNGHFRD